jgi:hypothetical protein
MKNKLITHALVVIIFVILVVTGIVIVRYFGGLGTTSVKETNQPTSQPTINESSCAKVGERSVSNFDMTTGKINPNIKIKNCCSGLKNIAEKQSIIKKDSDICSQSLGVPYNLCSPCGNGECDLQYEDHCNCPEDCK